ncbi:MAG: ribosome maturation factor RimP [Fusobacteria bacterium]|nr:ribosome maturation factor RimP [Fusobacteriota bacterium]
MSTSQKIEDEFRPLVEQIGYELVYVEYVKEGPEWYLRYFIDSPNGIDINDCEKVSRYVEAILDEKEYIKGQYILEVSSLGLERPLRNEKDFQDNTGALIEVNLFKSIEKNKKHRGILISYDETLILEEKGKKIEIQKDNISKANISIEI